MAIKKVGSAEKIAVKTINDREFESTYEMISEENNLVRCPACQRLLSKVASEGKTIQYKGLKAIITEGKVTMTCVNCGKKLEF